MQIQRDLSSPVPWRRSLRAARERRAKLALRRSRRLRGRSGVTLALALSSIAAGGAIAQDAAPSPSASPRAGAPDTLRAVQQKLGLTADGVNGTRTRAAVRRFQRANSLTVDGVVGPRTLAALGVSGAGEKPAAGSARSAGGGESDATLARIARCESGGDPAAVSSDGIYRGKYQFDRGTWQRLGGSGDPAAARESEQDRRALTLYRQRGTTPWPSCGG